LYHFAPNSAAGSQIDSDLPAGSLNPGVCLPTDSQERNGTSRHARCHLRVSRLTEAANPSSRTSAPIR